MDIGLYFKIEKNVVDSMNFSLFYAAAGHEEILNYDWFFLTNFKAFLLLLGTNNPYWF